MLMKKACVFLATFVATSILAACTTSDRSALVAPVAESIPAQRSAPLPSKKRLGLRLLFISDPGKSLIDIFDLPNLTLRAQIGDQFSPEGECTAADGSVWVTENSANQVGHYSRRALRIGELHDAYGSPDACAVDATTHTLAVANIYGNSDGPGSVLLYSKGQTSPKVLSNPDQYYYYNDAYDLNGNLFVDGEGQSGLFMLSECPAKTSACHTIAFPSSFFVSTPGSVAWYAPGKYLALADPTCSCIYHVAISGSSGTILGQTNLQDYRGDPEGFSDLVIFGKNAGFIAGANAEAAGVCSSSTPAVADRWLFPAGGAPTSYNDKGGLCDPFGATVSPN
jgi:hypothetical protein